MVQLKQVKYEDTWRNIVGLGRFEQIKEKQNEVVGPVVMMGDGVTLHPVALIFLDTTGESILTLTRSIRYFRIAQKIMVELVIGTCGQMLIMA